MQIRLIYASNAAQDITETDINDILKTATSHNAEKKITGMLCYDSNYFFQCLEGERGEVNRLYNSILHDSRHKELFLLEYSETNIRLFTEWSMAAVSLRDEDVAFLVKQYISDGFQPHELTASQSVDMIEALGTYLKGKTK